MPLRPFVGRNITVRAAAGTGKTWLLTSRLIALLLQGVAPGSVLAITFTRKAAAEIYSTLAPISAMEGPITVSTITPAAARIPVRRHITGSENLRPRRSAPMPAPTSTEASARPIAKAGLPTALWTR